MEGHNYTGKLEFGKRKCLNLEGFSSVDGYVLPIVPLATVAKDAAILFFFKAPSWFTTYIDQRSAKNEKIQDDGTPLWVTHVGVPYIRNLQSGVPCQCFALIAPKKIKRSRKKEKNQKEDQKTKKKKSKDQKKIKKSNKNQKINKRSKNQKKIKRSRKKLKNQEKDKTNQENIMKKWPHYICYFFRFAGGGGAHRAEYN